MGSYLANLPRDFLSKTQVISNSYAAGAVSGTAMEESATFYLGGLVGGDNGGSFVGCYFDVENTGQSNPESSDSLEGVTGLSSAQMKWTSAQVNMPAFDWTNTWIATASYPQLRSQKLPASISVTVISGINVRTTETGIEILNASAGETIRVYTFTGVLVASTTETSIALPKGVYIVRVGNFVEKVVTN